MDPKTILIKTDKGIDEIKTRANRLAQHRRNVLIFVDGRFSVGDLIARFSNIGDLVETLQGLVDDGYIAPKGQMATPPVSTSPATAAAPSAGSAAASASAQSASAATPVGTGANSSGMTSPATSSAASPPAMQSAAAPGANFAVPGHLLAEFKQEVRARSRSLYDAIGPDADNVTSKLEASTDRESFLQATERCGRMVEGLAGRRKAEAFRERSQAIVARFLSG